MQHNKSERFVLIVYAILFAITGLLLFGQFRSPPAWSLDVGSPSDSRFLAFFSVPETNNGVTFRWSGPKSLLLLHGTDVARYGVSLRIHGDQLTATDKSYAILKQEEHIIARMQIASGWRTYRVLLPESISTLWDTAPIALAREGYQRSTGDNRKLGFPLDTVGIIPLSIAPTSYLPAVWRTCSLVWILALCSFILGKFAQKKEVPFFLSNIVILPIALVLILWVKINPYMLAYLLPPIPWICTAITLVLLITQWGRSQGLGQSASRPDVAEAPPPDGRGAFVGVWHCQTPTERDIPPSPLGRSEQGVEDTSGTSDSEAIAHDLRLKNISPLLWLLLIFAVALSMRLYQIDVLPYGLWRDEARHGLVALRILEDPHYRPVYITAGNVDLPAAGLYPFTIAITLWSIHLWSLRIITAFAGAITVFPMYGLVALLTKRKTIGLLATALLAVSSWHITMSRFSFPTIFDPLLTLTGLWLLFLGMKRKSLCITGTCILLLSGICLGLAMQTYHTGRIVPAIAGIFALFLKGSQHWRVWLQKMAIVCFTFLIVVAPLGIYIMQEPNLFNKRVGTVFLLNEKTLQGWPPLANLDQSVGRHVLMFHVQGDANGRHHAPGKPMLDYITGLGFLIGFILLLRNWRNWVYGFLLIGLLFSILPSLLAVDGPHAMRSIGGISFACAIAAIGWEKMITRLPFGKGIARSARIVLVSVALVLNAWTYFVFMPAQPDVWLSTYPIHTQIGAYVRNIADEQGAEHLAQVYVPRKLAENDVFHYLAHNLPVQTFDGATLSSPAQPGARFIFSGYAKQEEIDDFRANFAANLNPIVYGPLLPDGKTASFVVWELGK